MIRGLKDWSRALSAWISSTGAVGSGTAEEPAFSLERNGEDNLTLPADNGVQVVPRLSSHSSVSVSSSSFLFVLLKSQSGASLPGPLQAVISIPGNPRQRMPKKLGFYAPVSSHFASIRGFSLPRGSSSSISSHRGPIVAAIERQSFVVRAEASGEAEPVPDGSAEEEVEAVNAEEGPEAEAEA